MLTSVNYKKSKNFYIGTSGADGQAGGLPEISVRFSPIS
jgi:hypothetical protein